MGSSMSGIYVLGLIAVSQTRNALGTLLFKSNDTRENENAVRLKNHRLIITMRRILWLGC